MSFPTPKNTAPLHRRYIGLYHYSDYFNTWDKILGIGRNYWIVQGTQDGEKVRRHSTPLHADKFADKPFMVYPSTKI